MQDINFRSVEELLAMDAGYLVTINIQHLYECGHDMDLRAAIFACEEAKLCIDGRGAQIVFQRIFKKKFPRVVGNELLHAKLSCPDCLRVLIIGSSVEVVEKIKVKYPRIEFTHDDSLIPRLNTAKAREVSASLANVHGNDFDLVALALGVPKQEILAQQLSKMITISPILCIGGSFEMLSGELRRAPSLLQAFGLEGVWRFLVQPNKDRFRRLSKSYIYFFVFFLFPNLLKKIVQIKHKE